MSTQQTDPAAGVTSRSAVGLGLVAALVASLCCVGPAILALLGLGGAAAVLSLTRYHVPFMIAAGMLLAAGVYLAARRRPTGEGAACCAAGSARTSKSWLSALQLLAVFAAAYALINFALLPAWYACCSAGPSVQRPATPVNPANLGRATLGIGGMTCEACTRHIQSELAKVPGVQSADVRYGEKRAVVTYDAKRVSIQELQKAVGAAGYKATPSPDAASAKEDR